MNNKELADRAAIKELIDRISIFGDQKKIKDQLQLFTEDAVSETFAEGNMILQLKGRKEMEVAFCRFLEDFDTVYHFNGQHVVSVNGDEATGMCYCMVTLIGYQGDKRMKTTIGAIYEDRYIRLDNSWLIAERIGNFDWQEKRELS